uniref:Uncharacterized protein n=1 Tax=Opuntia streptacantha TaxID=393608 RepID=A0A7C9DRP5_OPUST
MNSSQCLGNTSSNLSDGGQSFSFSISGQKFAYLLPSVYPLKNWRALISTSQLARQSIALMFESTFSQSARHITIGSQLKPAVCCNASLTITGSPLAQCSLNLVIAPSLSASLDVGQYR